MAKFYAVRQGRKPGIYTSWDECRREVTGYGGAEFKSFPNRAAAEEYMTATEEKAPDPDGTCAYVDGSYNIKTKEYSYGAVIFHNGETHCFSEKFSDEENAAMRNVAGEINGAMCAMRFCVENGADSLDLYYDYAGIEKWCTGEWKTNKSGTIAYKAYFDSISDILSVRFHKVKGHSGDKYNDMADRLAKDILGIA